jgi:ribosomal protein S18 acetylase RimI-like enzyme
MTPTVTIRRCTVDDAPALSALACRTFYDTFTGTCTEEDMQHFLDTYYSEEKMKQELANEDDYIFFALEHGLPVGYLRFLESPVQFPHPLSTKALELNRLYVDTAYRGHGVAKVLMDFYMDYAKMKGHRLLWLGVWEHNYRAQAFYKKYGFVPTAYTHPFPVGNTPQTDVWWVKELA